ncbi:MAG: bifunctional phosphoglucose/phosphomannose isomerase [Candidatus Marinimicrobia bacterium]|nr:bifunctional phosphoglucose/phosphomannose isomerase [Candidatus Neomarinimicrobiota bacterium]|tara:strand:+ start:2513 stop:3529 length:1017 start_codon:yes stop_codon:yes gene_type:complete
MSTKSNMHKLIYDFPKHIEEAINNFNKNCNLDNEYYNIESIMILGMGGSAITGLLIEEILKQEIKQPIYINQNYNIPKWVNKNTLVIASSYSGNTEETLAACQQCIEKKCKIIGFSTGGKLFKLLQKSNYKDYIKMPNGLQPRAAIGYSFTMMLKLLNKIGIIDKIIINELKNSIKPLTLKAKELSSQNNLAYSIAEKIHDRQPIIYAEDGIFNIIAYRFKCQLAENSKILSFNNMIPEMNHNELEAFTEKTKKDLFLIWINDTVSDDRNKKRMKVAAKVLESKVSNQIFIEFDYSGNKILHYLNYINLVDWISYHCAILNGNDPEIIPNINELKNSL